MSQQFETLAYAAKDPSLMAPWNMPVRFPWLPAWLISLAILLALELAASFVDAGKLHVPLVLRADAIAGGNVFTIIALLTPLFIKRRGKARLLSALAGCVLLLSPLPFAGRLTEHGFAFSHMLRAIWLAMGFVVVALTWHGQRENFWRRQGPLILLATACLWLFILVAQDVDRFGTDVDSTWLIPGASYVELPVNSLMARGLFVVAAWSAVTLVTPKLRWNSSVGRIAIPLVISVALSAGAYLEWGRLHLLAIFLMAGNPHPNGGEAWDFIERSHPSKEFLLMMIQRDPDRYGYSARAVPLLPDDARTTAALAKILRENPNEWLANLIVDRIVRDRAYDAASVLLHYALFGGNEKFGKALVKMGIPQAAWAILYNQHRIEETQIPYEDYELAALLHERPNQQASAWVRLVREKACGRHETIPDDASDACDREIALFRREIDACDRLVTYVSTHPGGSDASAGGIDVLLDRRARMNACYLARIEYPEDTWKANAFADEPAAVDIFVRQVDTYLAAKVTRAPVAVPHP